jgi:hypothetical protein
VQIRAELVLWTSSRTLDDGSMGYTSGKLAILRDIGNGSLFLLDLK